MLHRLIYTPSLPPIPLSLYMCKHTLYVLRVSIYIRYGLGTKEYEHNIILDCFGNERMNEYKGQGRLNAVIVACCHTMVLQAAPGGRDKAKVNDDIYIYTAVYNMTLPLSPSSLLPP